MTAVDGDPLTGDPTGPDVRHLLDIVTRRTAQEATRVIAAAITPVPVIHEACGVGLCGGCSSRGCVTRANATGPVPMETPQVLAREQALTRPRWFETDQITGNGS